MRTRPASFFAAGLYLAVMVSAASAQDQPRFPMPPNGMGGPPGAPDERSHLAFESVQDDLKLTDKQKGQIKRISASFQARMRETFETARENGLEPSAVMSAASANRRQRDAAISKVLSKSQKERLAQIELQSEGLLALAKKEVAAKIKLNAAQSKKVKSIVEAMRESVASAMPAPPGGFGPGGGGPPGGFGGPGGGPPPGGFGGPGGGPPPGGFDGPGGGPPPGGFDGPGGGPPSRGTAGQGRTAAPKRGGSAPADDGSDADVGTPQGGPPGPNASAMRAEFAKVRQAVENAQASAKKKIEALLTDEQRAAFDKLLGEPFDFSTIRRGPPPRAGEADDALPDDGAPPAAKARSRRQSAN